MMFAIQYVRMGKDGMARTREKIIEGSWQTIVALAQEQTFSNEKVVAVIETGYH
jgi:hypothetical protein